MEKLKGEPSESREATPIAADPPDLEKVELVKSRIAGNYYDQAHVRNRILKALLETLDAMD